jgi:hypothetical protein
MLEERRAETALGHDVEFRPFSGKHLHRAADCPVDLDRQVEHGVQQ